MGRALARAEKLGIPSFSVTRQGFHGVVANAFAALGFSREASQFVFPHSMFLPASDLAPIQHNIDQIVKGLTEWNPELETRGAHASAAKVKVQGRDYQETIVNLNNLFLRNLWSDGLPFQAPTEERVAWLLTGADLPRETVVGAGIVLPRGGMATIESLAIALGMAGGRPEYMPVLIAAVEAIIDPGFKQQIMNATTCSVYPAAVVNGPVAKQVRINSGYGALGPDPRHPAGACIGRAIRLLLMNVGGSLPGSGTMAIFGGPGRYASAVFAEDEDGLPSDWEPLSVERGFPRNSNTVTVFNCAGASNINIIAKAQPPMEQSMTNILDGYAGYMSIPSINSLEGAYTPGQDAGLLLIPRCVAYDLSRAGWPKTRVKAHLFEKARIPDSPALRWDLEWRVAKGVMPPEAVRYPYPLAMTSEDIRIVVAGGEQSGHSYWMQHGSSSAVPQTREVKLPANWEELLKKADEDLGPNPDL
ncbi:MAG: hypothetical protein HYX92_11195 [Chloroflexi bacterium]|nr:hypothetical protein [Chloroflexota bacterium]